MTSTDDGSPSPAPAAGARPVERLARRLRQRADARSVLWLAAIAGLIWLVAASQGFRAITLGLWGAANVVLACVAAGWGFFHPRALLKAREPAMRWAFWLTLFGMLSLLSATEGLRSLMQQINPSIAATRGLVFLVAIILYPLLFVTALMLGQLGAALGGFAVRDSAETERAVRAGVGAWWLSLLLAYITGTVAVLTGLGGVAEFISLACFLGVPLIALRVAAIVRRPGCDPQQLAVRVVNWLSRRLVWRWTRNNRRRTLDLRGAALGILAAALTLFASGNLLAPIRMRALAFLVQFRATLSDARSFARSGGGPAGPRQPFLVLRGSAPPRERRQAAVTAASPQTSIVLLEMDSAMIRSAMTRGSEAAVQAEIIRALSKCGARRVVLPLPRLEGGDSDLASASQPAPTADTVAATARDLPGLQAAMRAAGNVVLAVPRFTRPGTFASPAGTGPSAAVAEQIERLRRAARETGQSDVQGYGFTELDVIPTRWSERHAPEDRSWYPPVPLVLLAAARGQPLAVSRVSRQPYAVRVAGQPLTLVAPDAILVDFSAGEPGGAFPRVPYSAVTRGEPLYAEAGGAGEGRWLPPKEYFRGKIIFLDALAGTRHETPVGTMSGSELLAHATQTVLSGRPFSQLAPLPWAIAVLLLGAAIGHICAGRDPLDASWRVAIPIFLLVAAAPIAFLAGRWIDPVLPIAAAIAAFALVTQFTFALERSERDRNRALLRHFVAPQVVEELLDDPERELGLGGSRQQICVLFADVRGFTQFSERHTPEEVIDVINRYMTALREALYAHGGILDKYTGDGLMALFRVTGNVEEDVARAVRAALAMRDAAAAVSAQVSESGGDPLALGIGMHFGEAIVGLIGNPDHFNYTALGRTVIVSQRLQGLAQGGEVVVSDAVHAVTAHEFAADAGDPVRVKGLSQPVLPFWVS